MNARERFIEQVKPLLETPHAQWTKQVHEECVRRIASLNIEGRGAAFFIYGWRTGVDGQKLVHGKTDAPKERNYRSFAHDLGQQWLMLNPQPVEKNAAGYILVPQQEVILKHKTGQTRFNLILDFDALTVFIKRLGKLPLSRFA